ncbi:MAG TPA: SAM-dependent methyltransferase, partial [Pseudonocardiaceae bacterium]
MSFVGAGPGAGDLVTVRGARLLAEADVVAWSSATVAIELVQEFVPPGAEVLDIARRPEEDLFRLYRRSAAERLAMVRLIGGDAGLGSGLDEHLEACRRLGLRVQVVPGVAPLAAVVAATGGGFDEPTVLVTGSPDEVPPPEGAIAVTVSAARADALVATLRAAGRPDDTPVVVGHKATRPDELVVTTTLGRLEHTVKQHRLWLPTIFLVGRPRARRGTAPRAARTELPETPRVRTTPGSAGPGASTRSTGAAG